MWAWLDTCGELVGTKKMLWLSVCRTVLRESFVKQSLPRTPEASGNFRTLQSRVCHCRSSSSVLSFSPASTHHAHSPFLSRPGTVPLASGSCRRLGTTKSGDVQDTYTPAFSTSTPLTVTVTKFGQDGSYVTKVVRRSDLLLEYGIHARDLRFSTLSSMYVRGDNIIVRLQHIKAIVTHKSLVLLDSDHTAIATFLPELKEKLDCPKELLPFEFIALEALLMKISSVLEERLGQLQPSLVEVLNTLLDPRLFSVDRGQLHILLHHSKSLSEFHSLVKDVELTLTEMLDSDVDLADMYLTHYKITGEDRDIDDIEEISNLLEAYQMQVEDMISKIQELRELIDRSESVILINLDSQRNVMLRLSLQLEMGVFSATVCGMVGVAFGMNLDSSLEQLPFAFWMVTGAMITGAGLLWRRLLLFLGRNLDRSPMGKLKRPAGTIKK